MNSAFSSAWILNGRSFIESLNLVAKHRRHICDLSFVHRRHFRSSPLFQSSNAASSSSTFVRLRRLGWKTMLVAMATGSYLYMRWSVEEERTDQSFAEQKQLLASTGMGGSWKLQRVSDGTIGGSEDFLGDFALLYFGFTNCPDICPDEIAKAISVVDRVDETRKDAPKYRRLVPVFVTLDPHRDTLPVVKKYVAEFSPKILGYVGSEEEIAAAAKQFKVYYGKGPPDEDGDYVVDHSIVMYLVGPDGIFLDYYGQSKKGDEMTESVLNRIKRWEKEEKKNVAKGRWMGVL